MKLGAIFKASDDSSVHDEVVSWFLYSSTALVVLVGANVVYLGDKVADFFAYALPCLAGICVGANLVREKSERIIWVVSIIFLLAGFNFFLATMPDSEFYYALEVSLLLSLFAFTLVFLRTHGKTANEMNGGASRPKRVRAVVASVLVLLLSIGVIGYSVFLSHKVHQSRAMLANNQAKMRALNSMKHPGREPNQAGTDRKSNKENP